MATKAYRQTMGVAFPVESINRKLALRSEKAGVKVIGSNGTNAHNVNLPGVKYIGGMTRGYWVVTGSGKTEYIKPQTLFVRKYNRLSQPSVDELELRDKFRRVSKAANSIMHDLSQLTSVQVKFEQAKEDNTKLINGVSVRGYSSIRDWVFAVQYAGLKASSGYNINTFPNAFDA